MEPGIIPDIQISDLLCRVVVVGVSLVLSTRENASIEGCDSYSLTKIKNGYSLVFHSVCKTCLLRIGESVYPLTVINHHRLIKLMRQIQRPQLTKKQLRKLR